MTVRIDQFDSTVEMERSPLAPTDGGAMTQDREQAGEHRDLLDRLARDAERTRAEDYSD